MGKGPFVFNPENMEFRRRDRNTPWEEEEPVAPEAPPAPSVSSDPVDPALESMTVASLVEKPDGYVDPTPARRRRRSRSEVKKKAAAEKSTAWRGVMWGLILIMAVFWVYMLYSQSKKDRNDLLPKEEQPFEFDREVVVPVE